MHLCPTPQVENQDRSSGLATRAIVQQQRPQQKQWCHAVTTDAQPMSGSESDLVRLRIRRQSTRQPVTRAARWSCPNLHRRGLQRPSASSRPRTRQPHPTMQPRTPNGPMPRARGSIAWKPRDASRWDRSRWRSSCSGIGRRPIKVMRAAKLRPRVMRNRQCFCESSVPMPRLCRLAARTACAGRWTFGFACTGRLRVSESCDARGRRPGIGVAAAGKAFPVCMANAASQSSATGLCRGEQTWSRCNVESGCFGEERKFGSDRQPGEA